MIDVKKFGSAVTLMSFEGDKIEVNKPELDKMFNNDDVKNSKIAILSVVGAFRGGKSFLLGYCLRYLYAHYPSINNPNPIRNKNWMGDKTAPLDGFEWQFGINRVTSGLIMWNDVFFHTCDESGDKIAILLLDTQGLFDNQSTSNDNFRVFALGTLLSSIQIFNISTIIHEDQLQYLQFATEFAQCFGTNQNSNINNEKPFQKLIFLIRDFRYPKDYSYGLNGGKKYIKKIIFDGQNSQKQELQSVRQHITKTFDQICCCLLPKPGTHVEDGYEYDGSWSKMDIKFRDEFKEFIENILGHRSLVTKKINSIEVTGREFKNYINTYFQLFQSSHAPQIKSFAEATIENFMNELLEKCIADFKLVEYTWEDVKCIDKIPEIYEDFRKKIMDYLKIQRKWEMISMSKSIDKN
ncbi:atlastin-like [Chironomus tepperi]|uniref:atlastin-like n=1 Tax=Chironomus tepperi TaxID=113505 RepID=UPI00391FABD4